MAKITAEEIRQHDQQELKDLDWVKRQLRNATRADFQIVDGCSPFPYAASFYGCYDLAHFKRKADCERFINAFPAQAPKKRSKDG